MGSWISKPGAQKICMGWRESLRVVGKKMLFKAMSMKSVYRRDGRGPGLSSEENPIRTKRGE